MAKIEKTIFFIIGLSIFFGLLSFFLWPKEQKSIQNLNENNVVEQEGGNDQNDEPAQPIVSPGEFGKTVELKLTDEILFSDGLKVTLEEITDSRCPEGVECIWPGEIGGLFSVSGGQLSSSVEFRLGVINNKKTIEKNYVFFLKDATTDTLSLQVDYFKQPEAISSCYVGGCNSEICSNKKDQVSVCLYKEEYICYKSAKCEVQQDNECGWTQTPELVGCLSKYQ